MVDNEITYLYNLYSGDVYRFLFSICHDAQTAEDLMQVVFLRVLGGLAGFRGDCSIKTWIFAIARREYFRWSKKNPPTAPLDEQWSQESDLAGDYHRHEQAKAVFAYLDELDEPRRTLMRLRLTGGLSYREIGMMLGKTEVWARVTFLREKRKLLEALKEELQ